MRKKNVTVGRHNPHLPAGKVILFTSAMFTFISSWRVAAVVLSDLASTAFYIGGIVEEAIGAAAPVFILAVMLFSYAVRAVYIESCSMFVRGGVYRVVKEGLGGTFAKFSVSALLFDYVLTGPISSVSAGQYVMGLALDLFHHSGGKHLRNTGSVVIACAVTVYFYRQNLVGIVTSSGKAVKIMVLTTVMAAVILIWSGVTLATRGPANALRFAPSLAKPVQTKIIDGKTETVPKLNPITHRPEDPLGFAGSTHLASELREPDRVRWLSLVGLLGILFAFGHSILAMSGEETLGQVYREVAAPKLKNFKRSAFIIFLYSLIFTGGISFLAVLLIPDAVRMEDFSDNLIAGLAMHMAGPTWSLIGLHAFVVVVGFLILSGAVNTAMVGSNGVLSRVAEDGVLPDWLLVPHRKYGSNYRILTLIAALQIATILISHGNVLLLGEAYAFGVVWSFIFKAAAMIALRFKSRKPRRFKVPGNIKIRGVEVPIGLTVIFLVLFAAGIANLLSKEVATVSGLGFSFVIFAILLVSEKYVAKDQSRRHPGYLEQFNAEAADTLTREALGVTKPRAECVPLQSDDDLPKLAAALKKLNPETTDLVVLLWKHAGGAHGDKLTLEEIARLTEVVKQAEAEGKPVKPVLVRAADFAAAQEKVAACLTGSL